MFLLFDISANGNPRSWKAPYTDTFNWPRMIHLAWLVYDKKGQLVEDKDFMVNPVGYDVSPETLMRHKLQEDMMQQTGLPVQDVLSSFNESVNASTFIIAFNLQFHENVIMSEFYRENIESKFFLAERICLMRESTYFCKLEGPNGRYKWPSLLQLHTKLFGGGFENNGNAHNDVMAVSRCFNKLMDLGALEDLF